jgi:hypothetical protein
MQFDKPLMEDRSCDFFQDGYLTRFVLDQVIERSDDVTDRALRGDVWAPHGKHMEMVAVDAWHGGRCLTAA